MSEIKLLIEAQEDTPMVQYESDGVLSRVIISGVSMPENTLDFYLPLVDQLITLLLNKSGNELVFHLDYMNSMSNKQVLKLIHTIHKNDPSLSVVWKYSPNDDLIKLKGEEMKNILNAVNINVQESA